MESHRCKLCYRSFANGRALGGHMKAHLAALPLPPPKRAAEPLPPPSGSSSSSSSAEESEEKAAVYELRENPKKSFKFADPVYDHHSDIVVQDRASETESGTPTRKRSKRTRKSDSPKPGPSAESPVSSVSDTSPEEDVAICLMMLSRDKWLKNETQKRDPPEKEHQFAGKIKVKKLIRRKKRCEKCMKQFRSYRALLSHEKICRLQSEEEEAENFENRRIFKCPFCFKLFGSGQALGGHKRSHLLSSNAVNGAAESLKLEISLIDLNLPAPVEEDDYSVVSDA